MGGAGVIEFVGPSGSGKSSVARAVLALPDAPTWGRRSLAADPQRARLGTVARTLPAVAFVPHLAWRLARDPRSRAACRRLGRSATASLLFNAGRNRWQARLRRAHLHDQGLVQHLAYRTRGWPEAEQAEALDALYAALGAAAAPSLIVRFDVAPEVAASRSKMAGELHHDPAEVAGTDAAIEHSVEAAVRALAVPTIRTANDDGTAPAETAAHLLTTIASTPTGGR